MRALEAENFQDVTNPPIRSVSATAAREEFLADYYRAIVSRSQPTMHVATTASTETNTPRPHDSQIATPSLLIPTQDVTPDYIYLPQ